MTGTSDWKAIRERRVGDDPARVERAREAMVAELRLAGLRRHRKASQADVARRLAVSQANVSQIERGDVKLSTLAGYVDALGGKLELHAVFDDETVSLSGTDDERARADVSAAQAQDRRGRSSQPRTRR